MKFKKILLKEPDTPNVNGIIFSKEAIESIHNQIQLKKGKLLGELGQTNVSEIVCMKDAKLVVTDSHIENNKLYVDIELLDLPNSGQLIELIKSEMLVVGGRYTAKLNENNEVDENISIHAIDLIAKEDTLK